MNSQGALRQLGLEFRSSDFETICLRPGLPRRRGGKESTCQCRRHRRHGFDPWVGKILWRRKWQPTLVFLPGKFHGQQSLAGYNPWGCKESDMTGWLSTHTHTCAHMHTLTHMCTQTHTGMHAHTHTHTHTHMPRNQSLFLPSQRARSRHPVWKPCLHMFCLLSANVYFRHRKYKQE